MGHVTYKRLHNLCRSAHVQEEEEEEEEGCIVNELNVLFDN